MAYDIKQIRIGKHDFGIVGLTGAIASVARAHKGAEDSVIAEALFQMLSRDNYIPAEAKENYKVAFLRAYQKDQGLPLTVEDAAKEGLVVTVVGPGCSMCDKLELDVMNILSKLKLAGRVDHIRDLKEIAQMGIMGTPALLINGEKKCAGSVPSQSQLFEWLKPFQKEQ